MDLSQASSNVATLRSWVICRTAWNDGFLKKPWQTRNSNSQNVDSEIYLTTSRLKPVKQWDRCQECSEDTLHKGDDSDSFQLMCMYCGISPWSSQPLWTPSTPSKSYPPTGLRASQHHHLHGLASLTAENRSMINSRNDSMSPSTSSSPRREVSLFASVLLRIAFTPLSGGEIFAAA